MVVIAVMTKETSLLYQRLLSNDMHDYCMEYNVYILVYEDS